MPGAITGLSMSEQEVTDAYIYVLGRYLVIRQEHLDLSESGTGYNVIKHNPPVLAGSDSGAAPAFVNPNLDVVYSEAWIAVDDDTPVILEVPEVPAGLYYTAQIVDEWAEILHNVNERNFPGHPSGRFAICLAGSSPVVPADCVRLDIPTAKAKLLARVEIGDDLDRAVQLQHGFALTSTGTASITPAVRIEQFTNRELPGAWMFTQPRLGQALAAADSCPRTGDVRPLADKIAAFAAASDDNLAATDELMHTVAIPGFFRHLAGFSVPVNGWGSTGNRHNFGDDWGFRTTANYAGIWWNSALEGLYLLLTPDSKGHWPSGDGNYTVHFAGHDNPALHAKSFWSLTLYSHPDMYLVPNPIRHYSLGRQSDITRDGDSFTVYIGPELPEGAPETNWLPTPKGSEFTMCLRLYQPADDVLAGHWSPPPLVKAT
jgi:hypothetical protein